MLVLLDVPKWTGRDALDCQCRFLLQPRNFRGSKPRWVAFAPRCQIGFAPVHQMLSAECRVLGRFEAQPASVALIGRIVRARYSSPLQKLLRSKKLVDLFTNNRMA